MLCKGYLAHQVELKKKTKSVLENNISKSNYMLQYSVSLNMD